MTRPNGFLLALQTVNGPIDLSLGDFVGIHRRLSGREHQRPGLCAPPSRVQVIVDLLLRQLDRICLAKPLKLLFGPFVSNEGYADIVRRGDLIQLGVTEPRNRMSSHSPVLTTGQSRREDEVTVHMAVTGLPEDECRDV